MRIRTRLRKALFWGSFFLLACLAGVLGFAYWYVTDSENLARLIREGAPRFLRGAQLEVSRVRMHLLWDNEIVLSQVRLRQKIDKNPLVALQINHLNIRVNPKAMLKGQFIPLNVEVAYPTLQLQRRKDGTWNFEGVLADPWPLPPMKGTPPIVIQNGTVKLVEEGDKGAAILREVAIKIEPDGDTRVKFEGTAKGDSFEHINVRGTFDQATGQVTFTGDLSRLTISDSLRGRIPAEYREAFDKTGLKSGEVSLQVGRVTYNPEATPPLRYEATARIHSGVLDCPKLPFPINDLTGSATVRDGHLTIDRADGNNGPTAVRITKGHFNLEAPTRSPFDLSLEIFDLELDKRLRDKTPREHLELWNVFRPRGRINVAANIVREKEGGPIGCGWTVFCRDVGIVYKFFPYPVDHIQGLLRCENNRISLNLQTVVGNKPLEVKGTIDNSGGLAPVILDFGWEGLPIDKTVFDALPPDIRKVVNEFKPSGTVKGKAKVERTRNPLDPNEPREGKVVVDAFLDLNGDCAIKWVGMPYPVGNLTGRLELHPDLWVFKDMRGSNGQAVISGSGVVKKVPRVKGLPPTIKDPIAVDMHINAENIPFNSQLQSSLPKAWQKSWATLNPIGSCDADVKINLQPGKPDEYHLEIDPKPETLVQLKFSREPRGKTDPGGTFDLRMENVRGRFVYHNALVQMRDVGFVFHGTPVQFDNGTVKVEDSGEFHLRVAQVRARGFRMDGELRKMMPPVMAQFAHRLDEGRPIALISGNLGLNWAGPGKAVNCDWDNVLVVLSDNLIQAGIPLEHIQGQLDTVRGKFDGERLAVQGIMRLSSISLLKQHVTELETPFIVDKGVAALTDLKGKLLGGDVFAKFRISLDDAPQYAASVQVLNADLQRYAMTQPHKQSYRGLVSGEIELSGMGSDFHTIQGKGGIRVTDGALGELPVVLRLVNKLNFSSAARTAFDSADVGINIVNGESTLDPIKLTGDTFSLRGRGTMDPQGDLDLRLSPVYGRDKIRVPFVSDAVREATGQLFVISIKGPIAFPMIRPEALPSTADALKLLNRRTRRE